MTLSSTLLTEVQICTLKEVDAEAMQDVQITHTFKEARQVREAI